MLDSSYYYNSKILTSSHEFSRQLIYQSLALSNIGSLFRMEGRYEEALQCYRVSLDVIDYDPDETSFVRGIYTNMGNCYLKMGNLTKTRQMIDSAEMYIPHWSIPQRAVALYELKHKYYIATLQPQAAFEALDSLNHYKKMLDHETHERYFLLAQQEKIESDMQTHKAEARQYKTRLIGASLLLFLISIFATYFTILYRKKQNAYRKLVEKNTALSLIDEFEENSNESCQEDTNECIFHNETMAKIKQYVIHEQHFRDCDLTINKVSEDININRSYISQAINKTTGENFKSYINTIRINEAIRTLNKQKSDINNMEEFASSIGFTGRSTFYTNFKKVTGLTPNEFKNNMAKSK